MLSAIATEYHAVNAAIAAMPSSLNRLAADLRQQRDALVYAGFFAATPWEQLAHLPRYLQAMRRRLAKYAENPARDARHADALKQWSQRISSEQTRRVAAGEDPAKIDDLRWMLEELRVSLFAQELKTPYPISIKRIEKAWQTVAHS